MYNQSIQVMIFRSALGALLCLASCVSNVVIENNAYKGIAVSFSKQLKEQHFEFEKFKKIIGESSSILYRATRKRGYFEDVVFVLPPTWSADHCDQLTEELPDEVSVHVTGTSVESVRAQHSGGCGERGEIIYMQPQWLSSGSPEDLARRFVRQWSVYRYGVFEETPLSETCFVSSRHQFSPAGCYDADIAQEPAFSEEGLPVCRGLDEISLTRLKSSLMFDVNSSKADHFCDGSATHPHRPAMPTLHNVVCEGRTSWSVVHGSADFSHGKNPPSPLDSPPPPKFRCFREPGLRLTLSIQSSSTKDITKTVDELRYSIYHFLRNVLPSRSVVHLVTFSDDSDPTEPIELKADDEEELSRALEKYVVTTNTIARACLECGIQKAFSVSRPSSVAVVVALQSSLATLKTSDVLRAMRENPRVRFHLLLLKDGSPPDTPTIDLLRGIQSAGGHLHLLPEPQRNVTSENIVPNVLAFKQLNMVLAAAVKPPLQVDDTTIVAHEGLFEKELEVVDRFVTPPVVGRGRLVYVMHCDLKGQITEHDPNCSLWDVKSSTTFKCGSVVELQDEPGRAWAYSFRIRSGVNSPVCASFALLTVATDQPAHLKGWMDTRITTPGKNFVTLYAEVLGLLQPEVSAEISGPGGTFHLDLRDNGNGDPDVKAGDGIYSRYFTSFKEAGIYGVTLSASVDTPEFSGKRSVRKKAVGSFLVTEDVGGTDLTPPSRVADLRVAAVDHVNRAVTLQWTAPGDDMDHGTAMEYEIKSASHPSKLMDIYFNTNDVTSLKPAQKPKSSGSRETHVLQMPTIDGSTVYYIALRAMDAQENRGRISNIAQAYVKNPKIATPDLSTSTSEVTVSVTSDGNSTHDHNGTSAISTTTETTWTSTETSSLPGEKTWREMLTDTKFIIIVSSFGGLLLLIIIINLIIWCYFVKKRRNTSRPGKKGSLRPPYNMNLAFQQETQSTSQSESDIGACSLDDPRIYSASPTRKEDSLTPSYSFHTSKSLMEKSKSPAGSDLGFRPVAAYATTSLSRAAPGRKEKSPPSPSNTSEVQVYTLGVV